MNEYANRIYNILTKDVEISNSKLSLFTVKVDDISANPAEIENTIRTKLDTLTSDVSRQYPNAKSITYNKSARDLDDTSWLGYYWLDVDDEDAYSEPFTFGTGATFTRQYPNDDEPTQYIKPAVKVDFTATIA